MAEFFMLPDPTFIGALSDWTDGRRLPRQGIAHSLVDARNRTLALLAAFGDTQRGWQIERVLHHAPPLWTLGQLAWFAEFWCLREPRRVGEDAVEDGGGTEWALPRWQATLPAGLDGADSFFDMDRMPPDACWALTLPGIATIKQYAHDVLDRVLRKLATLGTDEDAALEPFRWAVFHEDLRAEHLHGLLQVLGLQPAGQPPLAAVAVPAARTLSLPGGRFQMGWPDADGFVFDNECPPHRTYVPPFEIDAQPVTNGQYLEFVEDGGYDHPQWWSAAGMEWLMMQERSVWPAAHAQSRRAGAPRQPVRGAGVVPLGRPPPADRRRMGDGRRAWPRGLPLGAGVGVDVVAIRAVPRFRAGCAARAGGDAVRAAFHDHADGAGRGSAYAAAGAASALPRFPAAGAG